MIFRFTRRLLASLSILMLTNAQATDIEWDGTSYIRLPVRLGSDTRLIMPEPFDDAWEHDEEISATLLDANTLIIRPRTARIEQRLTLRGRSSGTIYLVRVSSSLPYAPLVTVHAPRGVPGALESASGISVTGLLRAMMLGKVPPGFRADQSSRTLLDQPPYQVVAEQVWQSFGKTGVIARMTSTIRDRTVPIVPANIQIQIPQLGALRAMAADDYELGPERPSSRLYIVYGR